MPHPLRARVPGPLVISIVGALWLFAICAGMKLVLDYQSAPGTAAAAPARWPRLASYTPPSDRATLVLLAHPRCACTRATFSDLAQLVARAPGRLAVLVLIVVPPGLDSAWAETSLWREAQAIPGARVVLDRGGLAARRFGAYTSGQAILYGADGRLLFEGGITPGRGHAGDNAGTDAIVALATNGRAERTSTPVYGCALTSNHDGTAKEDSACRR